MDAIDLASPPATVTSRSATPAVDRPGRWIGGLIGALVSLALVIAAGPRATHRHPSTSSR